MSLRTKQKVDTFVRILEEISHLSTSSRLQVGAIAVHKNFQKIASFGYNGSYPNAPINTETGTEEESAEPGKDGFIHAEVNMIAKFREPDPENYIIMLTHSPCNICSKVLVNAGFKYVYWINQYRETQHLDTILDRSGVIHGDVDKLYNDYSSI